MNASVKPVEDIYRGRNRVWRPQYGRLNSTVMICGGLIGCKIEANARQIFQQLVAGNNGVKFQINPYYKQIT